MFEDGSFPTSLLEYKRQDRRLKELNDIRFYKSDIRELLSKILERHLSQKTDQTMGLAMPKWENVL